jgi:hypothetical protein
MKLIALCIFASASLLGSSIAVEPTAQEQEFRSHIAQRIKARAIKDLKEAQQVAVCEPCEGKGLVIKKVLKSEFGVDSVGRLRVGTLWNSPGFPMRRILAFDRFELGGSGRSTDILCVGFFPIDDRDRIVVSEQSAIYLSFDELVQVLDESKRKSGKP